MDNQNIKEILNKLQYGFCSQLTYEKLLDYITNLQQENERLKETNVYCNRTDCVGRIKDSKKYDSVYQEKEDYKSRCEKAGEILGRYKHLSSPTEEQTIEQEEIVENAYDILNGKE